jgi:hypothetical protein
MSLFKHAMVSGINDALVDSGAVMWPNEQVGFEVCSKIAADLDGPDMLPDGGLAPDSALLIGGRLKEASDYLLQNGYVPTQESQYIAKVASEMNFADRAAGVASACMDKAAADASLTNVGPNTAESAAQTDQHAALDLRNRAINEYLAGVGHTRFPTGGIVGQQMVAPGRMMSPAFSNSLTSLDKQAAAGDFGSPEMAQALQGKAAPSRSLVQKVLSNPSLGDFGSFGSPEMAQALRNAPPAGGFGSPEMAQALREAGGFGSPQMAQALREAAPTPSGGFGSPEMARALREAQHQTARETAVEAAAQGAKQPGAIMRYLQSAKTNPFAAGGAKEVAKALAKHPGTHAALLAGLGAGAYHMMGDEGREVNASEDLSGADMGADSDEILRQIMAGEGVGQHASPELVAALNAEMQKESADQGYIEWLAEKIAEEEKKKLTERIKDLAGKGKEKALAYARSAKENPFAKATRDKGFKEVAKAVGRHPGTHLVGAAGLAYGGKKLYDKYKEDKEDEKSAALLEYLKAAADGSLTDVGENTPESAAHSDSVAALDLKNRAVNEYLMGVGKTRMPNRGQVYAVEHADQDDPVHTHNLPTDETKSAELAYVNNFRKIAADLGPYLPATMSRDEKVAHLQTMLGLPPTERVEYVQALHAG